MGTFSIWHWLVVLLVILLLFGSGKISGLMGDLAKGIKSFKQNIKEDEKPETETAEQKPAGSLAGPEAQASARTTETTSAPRG